MNNSPGTAAAAFIQASKRMGNNMVESRDDLGSRDSAPVAENQARPCQCKASDASWVLSNRTEPKCIFVDLGAADGNTFAQFLANDYGKLDSICPGGAENWEAILVEANPKFAGNMTALERLHPGKVRAFAKTAAYDCEAQIPFYLDLVNDAHNNWGSSIFANHPDVIRSGRTTVSIPTVNVNRVLAETAIEGDVVLVKIDIEGAEWDIFPCMAQSEAIGKINTVFIEIHPVRWSAQRTSEEEMREAIRRVVSKGVKIPAYRSPTL